MNRGSMSDNCKLSALGTKFDTLSTISAELGDYARTPLRVYQSFTHKLFDSKESRGPRTKGFHGKKSIVNDLLTMKQKLWISQVWPIVITSDNDFIFEEFGLWENVWSPDFYSDFGFFFTFPL
jgi:hypothetical protein